MTAQFWTAVASSIASIGIVAMLRLAYKASRSVRQLGSEHRFLMLSMALVLRHLNLEKEAREFGGALSFWEEERGRKNRNR